VFIFTLLVHYRPFMRTFRTYLACFAISLSAASLVGCDMMRMDITDLLPEVRWTVAPESAPADGQSPIQVALTLTSPSGTPVRKATIVLTSDQPSDRI
jgi:hypothetical protein